MNFSEYIDYNDDEIEEEKSKPQIKRELLELKELGCRLVESPKNDLEKLDSSVDLLYAINKARAVTQSELKRHISTHLQQFQAE